ncbi:DUF664 domain-containing protein [Nocardia wallacei]|uniref:mycothiol transferase n=1 Tax=Nocardia wallacei TaxID=480035 RepID=UPI00313AEE00
MASEVEQLRAVLEGLRASILKKLAGLDEESARRSTVGSRTNLAGLVQHLTFVESKWFEEIVAGPHKTLLESLQRQAAPRGSRPSRMHPKAQAHQGRCGHQALPRRPSPHPRTDRRTGRCLPSGNGHPRTLPALPAGQGQRPQDPP